MRNEAAYIYQRLASRIESQILDGVYRTGDKLPSIRTLCSSESVSHASVMHALELLEMKGFVEARPKSGYYVKSISPLSGVSDRPTRRSGFAPLSIDVSDVIESVFQRVNRPDVVNFGFALPHPSLTPYEKLSKAVASASRNDPELFGRYPQCSGIPELKRQLAVRLSLSGCHVDPEELIVTVGATEAMNLALQVVAKPGDTVVVESPCYFGILEMLERLSLRALPIPSSSEHGLNIEMLAQALDVHSVKAVVLTPSFSNPNGSCMRDDRRKSLLQLLDDHGVSLIEDDVYGDLYFGKTRPRPIKAYDQEGTVLYCSSFSKSIAPGMRVGWLAPGGHFEKANKIKRTQTIGTPPIIQYGLAQFLASSSIERHFRSLRKQLKQQVESIHHAVLSAFPEGTSVSKPQGGFVIWIELPETVNALELHRRALANGISVIPGSMFAIGGTQENRIRISCGNPFGQRSRDAIRTLGSLVRELSVEALSAVPLRKRARN
ncbi:PLP-dependent aminotransferase family protein [Pelagicoccus sp. SDUM812003]|uniref:aminotransferase-like domain-containing protein n=1 Tax=Pelagicoccus sp. SDUM812003 TaxID=3041267 RepID=UPI00280FBA43|nr:PLP-dependent aminotransferase family protein [Pelagicoccus sp. SDUM812003]MDQ8204321.1 PLP-dependent aminotransferase family protein [Pelagicoccus sp. SDUM812003]